MKFTTTKNTVWRQGSGVVPKSWLNTTSSDHRSVINSYFYDNIKCWDWDSAFDEEHDFVFDDGKAFRLYYSGWAEWHHENDDDNGLKDKRWVEEITVDEANVPDKTPERDWL